MAITFTKVSLPYGWLGNMSHHALWADGRSWPTAEHLFQALRFGDEASREAIRAPRSGFAAKLVARRITREQPERLVVRPCGAQDVANMEKVLRLKLDQHPQLQGWLLDTGEETIIEDCTRRTQGNALFWGAALQEGTWVGRNQLGLLWMRLREELACDNLRRMDLDVPSTQPA